MMRCRGVWLLAFFCGAGTVTADESLPDFQTCLNAEVARFERDLARADAAARVEMFRVDEIEFCGTIGIVICDRSDAPLGCQKSLAVQQDILRARVLDQLPEPDGAADPAAFVPALYARAWALAHGMSAGQDCAGSDPVMETWCRAREANGRLRGAMLAWQVARSQDLVAPATLAGWADRPAPVRPRLRPEATQ